MGTWNTQIDGNDTFLDIYQNFISRYNQGQNPQYVSRQILDEFAEMFEDEDDRNNSLFGLACAQWETKSLDPEIYKQVKEIIDSGNDLTAWSALGADDETLKQRKIALEKFLAQLSVEREKPKRRIKPKFEFKSVTIIDAVAPDSLKRFNVAEEFTNSEYVHTGAIMYWKDGGGSVFYFNGKDQQVSARWIDSQTLEVTHDKNITFIKKDNRAFYCGDDIRVVYIEQ